VLLPKRSALTDCSDLAVESGVLNRLRPLQLLAVATAVLGTLLLIIDTAAEADGFASTAVLSHLSNVNDLLFRTRTGRLLGIRLVLLVLVLIGLMVSELAPSRKARSKRSVVLVEGGLTAVAAGLLLTVSLAGHSSSAAADAPLAVAFDWTHLLAAGVWTGGLLALSLAALPVARQLAGVDRPAGADAAGYLTEGFATAAQICMVVVLTTGAYALLIHVDRAGDLRSTWGIELVVKLALWVVVLLVAAANTFSIVPRLSRYAASVSSRLTACGDLASAVRFELLLAALLVTIAAFLAGTAPPEQLV
jgi:putative copper export protein